MTPNIAFSTFPNEIDENFSDKKEGMPKCISYKCSQLGGNSLYQIDCNRLFHHWFSRDKTRSNFSFNSF
jgi:hypothetical protein